MYAHVKSLPYTPSKVILYSLNKVTHASIKVGEENIPRMNEQRKFGCLCNSHIKIVSSNWTELEKLNLCCFLSIKWEPYLGLHTVGSSVLNNLPKLIHIRIKDGREGWR